MQIGQQITLFKQKWEHFQLKLLRQLRDPSHDVEVAAFVMDEGIAHLCYVKTNVTIIKKKIEKSIPRKGISGTQKSAQMKIFFDLCYDEFIKVDFSKIKCFILASPGFVKDEFYKHIKEKMNDEGEMKHFKQFKILEKLLLVHSSTGYKDSLSEVLGDPSVIEQLGDTKASQQIKLLEQFKTQLMKDDTKAYYGMGYVRKCVENKAVEKLFVTDTLFRQKDMNRRKEINLLMMQAERQGGEVVIFSSSHASGKYLDNLTGIACLLRFSLDLEEEEEPEEEEEKKKNQNEEEAKEVIGYDDNFVMLPDFDGDITQQNQEVDLDDLIN